MIAATAVLWLASKILLATDNTTGLLGSIPFARTACEGLEKHLAHAHDVEVASAVGRSLWSKAKTFFRRTPPEA